MLIGSKILLLFYCETIQDPPFNNKDIVFFCMKSSLFIRVGIICRSIMEDGSAVGLLEKSEPRIKLFQVRT